MGLRLAATLRRFWWRRGYVSEGRRWRVDLLARADQDPTASGKVQRFKLREAAIAELGLAKAAAIQTA